jgi:hypothetical protein
VTRADGAAEFLWQGRWMPLGVVASATTPARPPTAIAADRSGLHSTLPTGSDPEQGTITLRSGDALWLYTDGLVERRGRSLRKGLEELARAAASTRGAIDGELISSLLRGDVNQDDDACVLRLEWGGRTARSARP